MLERPILLLVLPDFLIGKLQFEGVEFGSFLV
jgi:hypothetical protein